MDDVLARAWAQIKWEEDEVNASQSRQYDVEPSDRRSRNNRRSNRNWRAEPYPSTHHGTQSNRQPPPPNKTLPPRLEEHNFSVGSGELVQALTKMGDVVKWPPKTKKPADQRDRSKWCDFHYDHGHRTADCIALRMEVAELLRRGHLTDLLTKKGKSTFSGNNSNPAGPTPAEPPKNPRTINCITGGSSISGVTYSAAKRHTRLLSKDPNPKQSNDSNLNNGRQHITFFEDEIHELDQPHDDALVISVYLGNFDIKRVLVDLGSSVNMIYLETVKEMGLESQINRTPSVLVFGNGASDKTIGEITLLTYAVGLNLPFRYQVMDCPSAYNALLGRPWIHRMRAVPSTLHQVVKFQTPWGVRSIRGQQRIARECYQTTLKPTDKRSA